MKRFSCGLLILSILLLSLTGALAEPVTDDVPGTVSLVYSYGEDAHERHMDDVKNTVLFQGNAYEFEDQYFEFERPGELYGGKTRAVFEFTAPESFQKAQTVDDRMYLGRISLKPKQKIDLYVFSGDRVEGRYTLIDQQHTSEYSKDVYATKDENGVFRHVDLVFLYSYETHSGGHFYAASLYFDYEGFDAAPALGSPNVPVTELPFGDGQADRLPVPTPSDDPEPAKDTADRIATEVTTAADELSQTLIDHLREENAGLKTSVAVLNEKISSLLSDKDTYMANMLDANARAERLEAEKKSLNAQVESLNAKITSLEDEKKLLTGDAKELNEKIAQLEDEKAALTIEAEELNAGIATLEDEKKSLTDDSEALTKKVAQLESDKTALTTEAEDLNAKIAALEGEKTALTAEVDGLNAKVAALEGEKTSLTGDAEGLGEKIVQLEDEKTKLTTETRELNAKIAALEGEKAALTNDAKELAEKVAKLEGEKTELTAELEGLNDKIKGLESEKTSLTGDAEELTEKVAKLESDKAALELEVESLNTKIAALEGEKTSLTGDAEGLAGKIAQLEDEQATLTVEIETLTARVEALKARNDGISLASVALGLLLMLFLVLFIRNASILKKQQVSRADNATPKERRLTIILVILIIAAIAAAVWFVLLPNMLYAMGAK